MKLSEKQVQRLQTLFAYAPLTTKKGDKTLARMGYVEVYDNETNIACSGQDFFTPSGTIRKDIIIGK
jgi:hypothetical protein